MSYNHGVMPDHFLPILVESRYCCISDHHYTRTGKRGGFQQTLLRLFSRNSYQEARGKDKYFLTLCSLWLCRVGLYRSCDSSSWSTDFCSQSYPSCESADLITSKCIYILNSTQCYMDCVWGICSTRYAIDSSFIAACQRSLANLIVWSEIYLHNAFNKHVN